MRKIVKYISGLFVLILISHCKRIKSMEPIEVPKTMEERPTHNQVAWSGAIVIDSLKVYSRIDVRFFSIDSIIVSTNIVNRGRYMVSLYKPLLPNDSTLLNVFSVLYDSAGWTPNACFIAPIRNYEYLSGDQSLLPVVVADLDPQNFILLEPGASVDFMANIATKFDFKILQKKRVKDVQINYLAIFPLIKEGRLATGINDFNEEQPIYFVVHAEPDAEDLGRVRVNLW